MVGQQKVTETGTRDQFTHVYSRICELDRGTDGASHVVRAYQLTDAGSINARQVFQVQDNLSLAATEQRGNLVAHFLVHRSTKGAVDVKDRDQQCDLPGS